MAKKPVAFVAQSHLPLPPLLGGAVQAHFADISSRIHGREVLVLSPAHPGLEREKRVGNLTHLRLQLPAEPIFDAKGRELGTPRVREVRQQAYLEAVAEVLEAFDGSIVVGNRPHFASALRSAAPEARLVLSLLNPHVENREALASYDAIIAISEFVHGEVVAALEVQRLLDDEAAGCREPGHRVDTYVIRGGVDVERFKPLDPALKNAARRRLCLPDGPVVLFAGRIVEYKGAHRLLEAFPKVLARLPNASLLMVGATAFGSDEPSPYERALRERAKRLSSVHFAGFVPPSDTPAYWAAADVFCGPALWDEPLGLVYQESLASGVPPVGSARGGIPEVVDHGETGLLLSRSPSSGEIADALLTLLCDPNLRDRLARRGREVAESRFAIEDSARATEAVLRD